MHQWHRQDHTEQYVRLPPNMKKFIRQIASKGCFFALLLLIFSTEQRRINSIQQGLLPIGQHFVDSIPSLSSSSNVVGSVVVEETIDAMVRQLNAQNLRYYMYDEPEINLKGWIFKRHPDIWWKAEEKNDEQMFRALEKSPLRTRNPNDADLFIIPIPFAKLLMQSNWNLLVHINDTHPKMRANKAMRLAIEALTGHPLYRQHWGMRHVLLNTPDACYRYFQPLNSFYDLMVPYYDVVYNVTAMLACDPNAVHNDLEYNPRAPDTWNEYYLPYKNATKTREPFSRWTASIGLGDSNQEMPLSIASMGKFSNSSNFIFYQSRREGSWFKRGRSLNKAMMPEGELRFTCMIKIYVNVYRTIILEE